MNEVYENEAEIVRLSDENERLQKQLQEERAKNRRVNEAVKELIGKVQELENTAKAGFNAKIRSVAAFEKRLREYYFQICERYPVSDSIVAMSEFLDKMEKVLLSEYNVSPSDIADEEVESAASGFDISEALNPTEDLESLCRDLGLI